MLEAALSMNERIRFKPHRTHPQMVGWSETLVYDGWDNPSDDEMVYFQDDEDYYEDDEADELEQFLMMQMMNGL